MRWIASICSAAIFAIVITTSCRQSRDDSISPRRISIAQLYTTAHELPSLITEDIFIEGRVVANDKLNEVERRFIVADNTAGVEIWVESRDIDRDIPLFSRVRVTLSGLSCAYYFHRIVLGKAPTTEHILDNIAESDIMRHVDVYLDADDIPHAESLRISEIASAYMLRYVHIGALRVIDEERGKQWCDVDTLGRGYNTTVRHLTDGRDTLGIVISGNCQYADEHIPDNTIQCYGIVDSYLNVFVLRPTNRQIIEE